MLEIIFDGVALLGCIILVIVFITKEHKAEKKRQEEYYNKLSESISVGVYSALVRFENYKLKEIKQEEIMRVRI